MASICEKLLAGDTAQASNLSRTEYPFVHPKDVKRTYNRTKATSIFLRDGFIDRYSGTRLVFPGALVLVSRLLPDEFPYHPNWKTTETHMAYWELFPELDHMVPIARDGTDDESNLMTTSVLRNCAKANWTLEELGWNLQPAGNLRNWDGLLSWFMRYLEINPSPLKDKYLKSWHDAAKHAPCVSRS